VRFAAWALFAAPFALRLPAMAFAWATRGLQAQGSASASADSFLLVILFALTLSTFPAAGVLIATRRPGTPIGWLLLAIGVGFGLLSTTPLPHDRAPADQVARGGRGHGGRDVSRRRRALDRDPELVCDGTASAPSGRRHRRLEYGLIPAAIGVAVLRFDFTRST
jgi:hypothetical protein